MPQLHNGTILNSKYRVDDFLQGGMKEIYKGKEILTDKEIAINIGYGDDRYSLIERRKLKRGANILKNIQHPHIITYVDSDIDTNHGFFLILEYIKGATLKEIYNEKTCPEHDLNDICITLLNALQYLHNMNILHRDISPNHIMISDKDELKLINFMKAIEVSTGRVEGGTTIIGNEYFQAPEQLMGYPTYQSDIFSVGATMWFLITGQPPRIRNQNGRILSAKTSNHNVSNHIDSIILKATDPDVANRYKTADEMIQALMVSSQ